MSIADLSRRDLARILTAVTDPHPDNDSRMRMDPLAEELHAADLIRWSGSPKTPGWRLTATGYDIVHQEVTA